MPRCDFDDVIDELVWENFLKAVKKWVWKKFGKKAALALAAALVDGPIPVGDIAALLLLLVGIIDSVVSIGDLWDLWNTLNRGTRQHVDRIIKQLEKEFGENFLDDPCRCECFKEFLRRLIRARAHSRSVVRRRVAEAMKDLKRCMRECA